MRERKKELFKRTCISARFMVRAGLALSIFTAALILQTARAQAQDKGTALSQVQRLNRAPVSKEILPVQLPRPTVVKLRNGLTLVLEEDHKLPTVAFTMWIRPGQLADPGDLPGLASFTAEMLREGTEKRTSEQIANEVDSLGATLEASSRFGSSYTIVTASGLITDASKILDLMSDVTLHPKFPADELVKYKQSEQAGLEQRLANPQFLAAKEFKQVVYGDTPMSFASPTKESIAKVTGDDLKKFHDSHYLPGNAILGVTGDFKVAEMQNLIEKYFNTWSGREEPQTKFAGEATPQPSKITLVDRPGSVQTFIIGGDRAIRRTDPQYYELAVMNQVVGGGPQARLFLDLREEHSLTYGAYSRVNTEIYPGDWQAFSPVRTPVTGEAMDRFIFEFKKINNEPPPQSEIDEAHRAIIANFALSLEQPSQILNDWLTVQYYGLPVDYWDKYPDKIAAIDAGAVQASAKKFVDLDHMQWICVGDRKQIEDVLKKYGPVSVVDVTGKVEN
jgi:zinc protease